METCCRYLLTRTIILLTLSDMRMRMNSLKRDLCYENLPAGKKVV
jgi:hypothetical protein